MTIIINDSSNSVEVFCLLIQKQHIDFMGHVNNTQYLQFFEEARWHYYQQFAYTIEQIIKVKKGPIILRTNICYKKELVCNEKIYIQSKCLYYRGKLGKMQQVIYKANKEIACIAEFIFGLFDLTTRKLILPSGAWLAMHQALGVLPAVASTHKAS